jgi:hypothetical protein
MSASFTIVVTDNYATNADIIYELNPNTFGNVTEPPEWLRDLSSYFAKCAGGERSVSIVYTDSSGSTTVHAGA